MVLEWTPPGYDATMRKRRGKLIAVFVGTVAVALAAGVAVFWEDFYCNVFLDPRLVGKWARYDRDGMIFEFDKLGKVKRTSEKVEDTGTYRIEAGELAISWPSDTDSLVTYQIEGAVLKLASAHYREILRRVPEPDD